MSNPPSDAKQRQPEDSLTTSTASASGGSTLATCDQCRREAACAALSAGPPPKGLAWRPSPAPLRAPLPAASVNACWREFE